MDKSQTPDYGKVVADTILDGVPAPCELTADALVNKDGMLYIKVKTTRNTHIKSGILYNMLKKVGKIEAYEKK